jgi:hypothetical protein
MLQHGMGSHTSHELAKENDGKMEQQCITLNPPWKTMGKRETDHD